MEEQIIYTLEYISCEGNMRWMSVIVNADVSEETIICHLMSEGGYDDAPATFISISEGYDDTAEDWTFLSDI